MKKLLLLPLLLSAVPASLAIEGYVPNNKDEARAIAYLEKLGAKFEVEIVPLPQYVPNAAQNGAARPAGVPAPAATATPSTASSSRSGTFAPSVLRPGLSSKAAPTARPATTPRSIQLQQQRAKQAQATENEVEATETTEVPAFVPALLLPEDSYGYRVSSCGGYRYMHVDAVDLPHSDGGYTLPLENGGEIHLPFSGGRYRYTERNRVNSLLFYTADGYYDSWSSRRGSVPQVPAEDIQKYEARQAAIEARAQARTVTPVLTAAPAARPAAPAAQPQSAAPRTQANRSTLTPSRAAQQTAAARSRAQAATRAETQGSAPSNSVAPDAAYPHRKVIVGIEFPKQEAAKASVSSSLHGKSPVAVTAQKRQPIRRFGDRDVAVLRPFQSLKMLDLSHTDLTDHGIAELENLRFKTLKDLPGLGLAKTRVTDRGVAMLAKFDDIERLDLSDTMVTDRGVYAIKAMKDMRDLDLSNTRVSDRCTPFLGEFWQLTELKLAQNRQVTNKGLTPLLKLKKLNRLDLGDTKVTPQAKAALQKRLNRCAVQ